MTHLLGMLGRRTLRAAVYLIDLIVFTLLAMREWRRHSRLLDRATYESTITQIIFTGVDGLPTVTLLGMVVGVGITTHLLFLGDALGDTRDVVDVLTQVVGLQLGSLLTAFALIGRSGAAIAVDLGNMKLNREVEGLELLGISINHFLVTPRLFGTCISQLVLSVYLTVLALVSGVSFAGLLFSPGYTDFLAEIPGAFDPLDLLAFVAKNLVFGLIIGAAACFHGLRVEDAVTEVPQQVQRAIANSLVLILLLNGILAVP